MPVPVAIKYCTDTFFFVFFFIKTEIYPQGSCKYTSIPVPTTDQTNPW